tara:strand:+ start:1042 stop:1677 length:636 start_codon:yes stop_codon:yes gene_type:complete
MNKISNYLHHVKGELDHEKKLFEKYVNKDKNILDIGGCIGVMSLMLSTLTSKKVYVYEPNPEAFYLLEQNIKNNNIKNVSAYNLGIGNTLKKTKILHSADHNIGQTLLCLDKTDLENNKRAIEVDLIKLDDIKVKNIGFIKIDVEGYELEVLKSGKNLLTYNKMIVLVEYHGFDVKDEFMTTKDPILKLMEIYNYKLIEENKNKLIFKNYV